MTVLWLKCRKCGKVHVANVYLRRCPCGGVVYSLHETFPNNAAPGVSN